VVTTFKKELAQVGVIFCSMSEADARTSGAGEEVPGLGRAGQRQLLRLPERAVFSDGSFVYVPPGVRCPMELSTYFRINAPRIPASSSAP
jgi:Fe-S cluster assembly protein SufB